MHLDFFSFRSVCLSFTAFLLNSFLFFCLFVGGIFILYVAWWCCNHKWNVNCFSLSLSLSQSAPLFNTKVPLSINIYTKQKYLPLDHKWTLKTATNTKTTKANFSIKTVVVCKFVKYRNFFNSKTVFTWDKQKYRKMFRQIHISQTWNFPKYHYICD